MKIPKIALLLVLAHLFAYAQTPPPPQATEHAIFDSYHDSLDALTRRFGITSASPGIEADIAQSLKSISDNVKFLKSIINSGKPIPKEYLESVALDAELLKKLSGQRSKSKREKSRLYDGLKEVESDLAIKVGHVKKGRGDGVKLVQVFVHAKKGDQDVGAYQVWYVPKGWTNDSTKFNPFDRLTSPSNPTSMNLAPGNYFIWLSKGQPVTSRQPVSIGGDGKAIREIDLVVP